MTAEYHDVVLLTLFQDTPVLKKNEFATFNLQDHAVIIYDDEPEGNGTIATVAKFFHISVASRAQMVK